MVNTKTTLSKKVLAIVLAVACMVAFTPAIAFTQSANAASKLKVSPTKATVYVAKTKKISAKGLTKSHLKKVKWTTSKKSVVSISKTKGSYTTAKGKKAGTAYVTAKYGKYKAKAKIVVKKAVVKTAVTAVTITNDNPATSGATTVGDKLVADTTPADATATYQWYADGTAISGATSHSYTVGAEAVGKVITVKATGVDKYDSTATSAATGKVATLTLDDVKVTRPNATTPTTLDTLDANTDVGVGDVLTTTGLAGAKTVKDVTYQWYRHDSATAGYEISGATSASYTVTKADAGKQLTVKVTPKTGILGTAQIFTTKAVSTAVSVKISNENAKIGDTLNAVTTPAAAASDVTYSWSKLNTTTGSYDALGVTTATYAPTAEGTYKVTIAFKTGEIVYTEGTMTATIKVAKSALGTYTIKNGTAYTEGRTTTVVGDELTASTSPAYTGTVTYQWYSYDATASSVVKTTKATGTTSGMSSTDATYKLVDADAGHTVFCKVTATDGDAQGQIATTNEVSGITNALAGTFKTAVSDAHVITATLSNTAQTGTYQWYKYASSKTKTDATAISGATEKTYTLTANDTGYTFYCVFTGTGSYTGTLTSDTQACYGLSAVTYTNGSVGTPGNVTPTVAPTLGISGATATFTLTEEGANIPTLNTSTGVMTVADTTTKDTYHVTVKGVGNTFGTVATTFVVGD